MSLQGHIVRIVLRTIPTFLAVATIAFLLVHLSPGTPLDFFLGANPSASEETVQFLQTKWGLDKPLWEQYLIWMSSILRGDFGFSYLAQVPVTDLLVPKIYNTLELMLAGLVFSALLAIPLGVISAVKEYSAADSAIRVGSLFGLSMPSFWQGLLLILVFAVILGILPAGGMTSPSPPSNAVELFFDEIKHLVLPVIVLATHGAAYIGRLTRSAMLDVLREDYVMTARAKGLKEYVVIYKHALRNALLPVVTAIGLQLAVMLGGAAVTETLFSWPGLGRAIVQGTSTRDYPVVLGVTVVTCFMVVFVTVITDVAYAFLDPRVRY